MNLASSYAPDPAPRPKKATPPVVAVPQPSAIAANAIKASLAKTAQSLSQYSPGSLAPYQGMTGSFNVPGFQDPALSASKQNAALDYSGDPILGEVKAANLAAGNAQEQSTNASIQDALLKLGSKDLAQKLLPGNSAILGQISEDPWTSTSTLGQLGYTKIQNVAGSNNASAANNTIFGSAHAQDLFDINRNYTLARQGAIGDTQSQIDQLLSGLAEYKRGLLSSNISAEGDAYQRAAAAAAASGYSPATPPPSSNGLAPYQQNAQAPVYDPLAGVRRIFRTGTFQGA